jgi:hypothetical protein
MGFSRDRSISVRRNPCPSGYFEVRIYTVRDAGLHLTAGALRSSFSKTINQFSNSMKFFNLLAAAALCVSVSLPVYAQVSINDTGAPPHSDAMLDVSSTTKGFLPPRMTSAERDAIESPPSGLVIYNTTTDCLNLFTGTAWKQSCYDCDFLAPSVGSNSPLCAGNSINLAASTVQDASYAWTGPNGYTSSAQNPVISNAEANMSGTYVLTTTVDGCSLTAAVLVTVNSLPDASFSYSPAQAVVTGTATFTPSVVSYPTYSWTVPNANPSASSASSPQVTWTTQGNSQVLLTVTDGNGCAASSSQSITVNCQPQPFGQTQSFSYTGDAQQWVVPGCVTYVDIVAYGAQGGDGYRPGNQGSGGLGGMAAGRLAVSGGQTLHIYVGGQGQPGQTLTGGWNGGGNGNAYSSGERGGGGGGASDVRLGGTGFASRVISAGGGGGGSNTTGANGGAGGYTSGTAGLGVSGKNGGGGSQISGGSGGTSDGNGGAGSAGSSGNGGNAGGGGCCGGGGGGGWFGGGGGGGCNSGGGGGGSSYITGLTNTSTSNGVRSGNGLVTISW